jgi:hypothetical protein
VLHLPTTRPQAGMRGGSHASEWATPARVNAGGSSGRTRRRATAVASNAAERACAPWGSDSLSFRQHLEILADWRRHLLGKQTTWLRRVCRFDSCDLRQPNYFFAVFLTDFFTVFLTDFLTDFLADFLAGMGCSPCHHHVVTPNVRNHSLERQADRRRQPA